MSFFKTKREKIANTEQGSAIFVSATIIAIPVMAGLIVFSILYLVVALPLIVSLVIALTVVIALLSIMIKAEGNERRALLVMAEIIKRQNEKKAETLTTSSVKELRGTVKTKEPVILNHFVKRRVEKRLHELGLLEQANKGESFEVVYSEEVDRKIDPLQSQSGGIEKRSDSDGRKESDCENKDKDAFGVCVKHETGREEIDSRAIQPSEERKKDGDRDENYFRAVETNPATGLPMLENGLDTMGNPRGFDFERERLERIAEDEQRRIRELETIEIQRREEIERLLQTDRDRLEAERERESRRRFEEERSTWGGYDSRY